MYMAITSILIYFTTLKINLNRYHFNIKIAKTLTRNKLRGIIYIVREEITIKSYSSREVLKMLKDDGWYQINCVGSHHQFKHPTKSGKVTLKSPQKDIPEKTLKSISKQSGLLFK